MIIDYINISFFPNGLYTLTLHLCRGYLCFDKPQQQMQGTHICSCWLQAAAAIWEQLGAQSPSQACPSSCREGSWRFLLQAARGRGLRCGSISGQAVLAHTQSSCDRAGAKPRPSSHAVQTVGLAQHPHGKGSGHDGAGNAHCLTGRRSPRARLGHEGEAGQAAGQC